MYSINLSLVLLFIIIITSIQLTSTTTVINQQPACICHHGYTAEMHPRDKRYYCKGILHEGKTACVNLERPNCKCTLGQGFIVHDLYGYWCVKVKPGYEEEIRWSCENKWDWDTFFKLYPEEKPIPNSQL